MQIAVSSLASWVPILILGLMPKKLSEAQLVFLFFLDSIFSISLFTLVELNLKYVTVDPHVDRTFGLLIGHIVQIPVAMLIVSNVFLFKSRWKWGIVVAAWMFLILDQQLFRWTGIIHFKQWNAMCGALEMATFIGLSGFSTWLITWIAKKDVIRVDRI